MSHLHDKLDMHSTEAKHNSLSIDWSALLGSDRLGLDNVELDQLSSCLLNHSPRSIRLHPNCNPSEIPFELTSVPWYNQGYWLKESTIRPGSFLQFVAGDYYIQDASSMLALALCRLRPGQVVCDLCAAPGGKASGLLEQLAGTGFLLANEVIQNRLALLQAALYRSRYSNHAVSSLDAENLAALLPDQFDCVLVDAPCSGQSMVGRDKQSAAAFTNSQVEHSAARQHRIVAAASQLVRPNGRLVYSTCTFAVAENEEVVEHFLNHHPEWQLDPMPELEAWASPRMPGAYRLWPHRDHCDGSFAAALIRKVEYSSKDTSFPRTRGNRSRWQAWSGELSNLDFLEVADSTHFGYTTWQRNDAIHLLSNCPWPQLVHSLHSGIEMARVYPKRIEPEYGAAIVDLAGVKPRATIELTTEQAKQYVRGESVLLSHDATSSSAGWTQVRWHGRPLSWGKYSNGILKNHFPKLLRNSGIAMA